MRRRKKPGAKKELFKFENYLVNKPRDYKEKWEELFENDNIHIELGTGRGQFITTLADENKDISYIGIEVKEEILLDAVRKADSKKLENIKFLWFNIDDIQEIFGVDEIKRVYINFCDPWPKKRHSKRRLTHRDFLLKYCEILEDKGEIHIKTDNEELFEFTLNEISDLGLTLKEIYLNLYRDEEIVTVKTEYEEKFISEGKKIFSLKIVNNKEKQKAD